MCATYHVSIDLRTYRGREKEQGHKPFSRQFLQELGLGMARGLARGLAYSCGVQENQQFLNRPVQFCRGHISIFEVF